MDAIVREIKEDNAEKMKERDGYLNRAQHPKGHGCVEATFTVRDLSDPSLRVGIFAEPKEYKAVIRFSNGAQMDDREKDAHGMAIKVLDVPGDKLHPGFAGSSTMDFILIDHPVMFAADLEEYLTASRLIGDTATIRALDDEEFAFGRVEKRLRTLGTIARGLSVLPNLIRFRSPMPASPTATHYWSQTPYRLGPDHAVKYVAKSGRTLDANASQHALTRELTPSDPTFTFGLHVQRDDHIHPIDDATAPWWPEEDEGGLESMVEVADIKITGFRAFENEHSCENLFFSPFNVTEDHRPLGDINAAREEIYADLGKKRHADNHLRGKCPFDPAEHGSPGLPK